VGFTDSEGSFSINFNKSLTYFNLRFSIELHSGDIDILRKIAQTLDIGEVIKIKNRDSALFYVTKFDDITKVIIPIFQEFPLQTTKHLDFICLSKAALIKLNSEKISKTDLIKTKKLKETMNNSRLIIDKKQEDNLNNKISINM
jgi:hypothetical protein